MALKYADIERIKTVIREMTEQDCSRAEISKVLNISNYQVTYYRTQMGIQKPLGSSGKSSRKKSCYLTWGELMGEVKGCPVNRLLMREW